MDLFLEDEDKMERFNQSEKRFETCLELYYSRFCLLVDDDMINKIQRKEDRFFLV